MGERRKRKSLWDMEEETKHLSVMSERNSWTGKDHHSGSRRYHEFSESRTTIAQKSRDHSGWQSWEQIEENPTATLYDVNTPGGNERAGGKRYYNDLSPGFDGVELRNHNHTREYDRSHSQRYLGRGRSRSRSRTRFRSRSRSLSRGRERERRRGRSRSRSRSDGNANNHTRIRSPIGDLRRQSYGWSDRRNSPEKSSKVCRDFAVGRCKRGIECRFFHPNSVSRRDGDLMEDDTTESWRSRSDHSRIPQHSYSRGSGYLSRDDGSDPYYGEDEQFIDRSRSAVPCKDFMKGDCRWGDACRFSHHAAYDDSFGQKNRNASLDKDIDRQPYKNGKPLCKFFAAGKCGKDNCRFSHEDPNLNKKLESRGGEVTDRHNAHDKSNLWNGPTWDGATRISDTQKTTGWGETVLANTTNTDDSGSGQNDDRRGRSMQNENNNWGKDTYRFSHDDPNLNKKLESRGGEVTDRHKAHDKSLWNGPTWVDATGITDTRKTTGFGETILANTTDTDDSGNGQKDDRGGRSLKNEKNNWGNDNRRISHADPNLDKKLESRESEVTGSHNAHDKSKWWNGPTWDDATRVSDTQKTTGWGETVLPNTTNTDDSGKGKNDDRGGRSLQNENNNWGIPEGASISLTSEKQPSLPGKSNSYCRDPRPVEYVAKDNIATEQEHLVFHGSQMQDQDGVTGVHGQNALQGNLSFSIKALQKDFFPASIIKQQPDTLPENNQMITVGSDVPAELKEIRYTSQPILFSGQNLNQNGGRNSIENSLISNGSDRDPNIRCPNPSSGFITNLNGPETHIVGPLDVQTQMLNNQKDVLSPGLLEAKVPQLLTKLLSSGPSNQVTTSPMTTVDQQVPPAENLVSFVRNSANEHSQPYPRMEVPSSRGIMPSFPNTSVYTPLVSTSTVQPGPGSVSLDVFNSTGNDRYNTEISNSAQGMEQNNQMQPRLSSPLAVVGTEVGRLNVKHPQSPRLRQVEAIPNSEVSGGIKAIGEESKGGQESKHPETLDGHGKVEELNKEEKGSRLFKNALIEFVKEILKPTWKEGRMSRDAHKAVVKKVVDKVSGTIQVDHIPKTHEKIEQYLSISRPKITKLVQAYVERCLKADS